MKNEKQVPDYERELRQAEKIVDRLERIRAIQAIREKMAGVK